MKNKSLYKSNDDIKIDGVCGGLAEYLDVDSTIVRVAWIFFGCMAGSGILAYILCMIIMPRKRWK